MAAKRPIDALRDSAKSGRIGSDSDDSAITEMIPMVDVLCIVKERGIYTVQLADQIDPDRTNASVPDTQQRILTLGSSDPTVARTLLTAHTLFDSKLLGASFDQQAALRLSLQVLKDIVALLELRADLEAAEADARAKCEVQPTDARSFQLPAVPNLHARCDAFAQKAGHIVSALENIARLFYSDDLKNKWIDTLTTLASTRYGPDSAFAQYMVAARLFLLFVLDMRNMIEHPKAGKCIKVHDFRMQSTGKIALPSVEIMRPGEPTETATITLLMKKMTEDLVSVTELLMAHLCAVNVQPFAGMPVQVVELPIEQRSASKEQRFFYGIYYGDQIVRFG